MPSTPRHSLRTLIATQLDPVLAERARAVSPRDELDDGEYVLYWTHSALRADENPALETALELADVLRLPMVVYQGLSESYPYASDRHHRFVLEGALDLRRQLAARRIGYVLHVERPGARGPYLVEMARRAALVVTDDMPVRPLTSWMRALGRHVTAPIVAVDTACVVPMRVIGRAWERAFEFRRATSRQYAERLELQLAPRAVREPGFVPDRLAWEPVSVTESGLGDLIAECSIDHMIGRVPHTIGGSSAGYARWEAFRVRELDRYAWRRNDPLSGGSSRMSAYLHYGMVAPQRLAREAHQQGGAGAEKFLDELLIWRELAYAFCFYRPDYDRMRAIPDWARQTLQQHQRDARPQLPSWETLARGRTGDALWDAAQQSLLQQGELHNQLRMTWGKALLQWTSDARQTLRWMIDLNHRYALDGRDPASYGGILWCLGQFDRPFEPEQPITGRVRSRPTATYAARIDVDAWRRHVRRPLWGQARRVAVVGAGLAGLVCARTLADHGLEVEVFEKSRGAGGRMATRREGEELRFDHGAQYFTVRDERFARYVESWRQDGLVAQWHGRIVRLAAGHVTEEPRSTTRLVGQPSMNSICRHLASGLTVHYGAQVRPPQRRANRWELETEDGRSWSDFSALIVATPAPQAAVLLRDAPRLAELAANVSIAPCWAALVSFAEPLGLPYDGAFVEGSPLSWICRNGSKPGRPDSPECWVLHAAPDWSWSHLEETAESVLIRLMAAFWQATGLDEIRPASGTAHRWRFALPTAVLPDEAIWDSQVRAGTCGDWCGGPRVEGAFLSGAAMAGRALVDDLG
ncbi:MAG: NAD(P)-binding protein [Pirellulales bacterium]